MKMTQEERDAGIKSIQEATPQFIYLMIIAAQLKDPDLKELNFVHQIMEFPKGERYMLQLVHLEGPKLKLDETQIPKDLLNDLDGGSDEA